MSSSFSYANDAYFLQKGTKMFIIVPTDL